MSSPLTIVIPTYNRAELLAETLRFLQNRAVRVPIIVADGSDAAHAAKNAETCRLLGENISHFHLLPPETTDSYRRFVYRIAAAFDRVMTPYVVFSGDDELLIVENALKAVDFLELNPDYVAAHGVYLYFRYDRDVIRIESLCYDGPSFDGGETGSRLLQLYSAYEPPFYAVFRTAVQQKTFEYLRTVPGNIFVEICHSTASIVAGKIKRLDGIFYLRNTGVPTHFVGHSWVPWMAADFDDFYRQYRSFRTTFIDWAFSRDAPNIDQQTFGRALDMMFVFYLSRGFDLRYWFDDYLSVAVRDQDERERLRTRLSNTLIRESGAAAQPSLRGLVQVLIRRMIGESGLGLVKRLKARLVGCRNVGLLYFRSRFRPSKALSVDPREKRLGRYSIMLSLWNRFSVEEWKMVCALDQSTKSDASPD